jgi:hypothetical protein
MYALSFPCPTLQNDEENRVHRSNKVCAHVLPYLPIQWLWLRYTRRWHHAQYVLRDIVNAVYRGEEFVSSAHVPSRHGIV